MSIDHDHNFGSLEPHQKIHGLLGGIFNLVVSDVFALDFLPVVV